MQATLPKELTDLRTSISANSVAALGFHDSTAGQTDSWFESATGLNIACFVHDWNGPFEVDVEAENRKRVSQRTAFPTPNNFFLGRPLIVDTDWADLLESVGINKVLLLKGNNRERLEHVKTCREYGFELVSAIHPSVTILAGATIEPGVLINAGSLIGYKSEVEAGVMIDTRVQIDHHNVLKECSQLDPGVVTAGYVTTGECSQLHASVTVINRIEIGADAIVGAGATVINDIPPRCTAVGVPAKVIKYH